MSIKLISLNLWIGGVLFDTIVDFLREQDADIVLLQEVLQSDDKTLSAQYRSLDVLREKLGYAHHAFVRILTDRFPWGDIDNGHAVLSKYPITSNDAVYFDNEAGASTARSPFDPTAWPVTPRGLQAATIETPNGELNIINLQGVWDLDGDHVSPERQNMRDIILAQAAGKPHVIIAGDTNAKHTNPVMRDIEKEYVNVFGDSLKTTFNMRRKDNPGYATAVVDMIYISDDLTVVSRECPDVDISDHLPLVATLEMMENKEDI